MPLRVDEIGLGRLDIGARLRDLFRPAAVSQPGYDLLLRRRLRCHLGNLRFEAAGIQARQHLALLDVVALLDQYRGDALAVVER